MFGFIAKRQMAAFERKFQYDMSYGRYILAASPKAFFKFTRLLGLTGHHEDVPPDALYAAKIVGTLAGDCGPCAQLVVTMGEREGVPAATLRAILAGGTAAMPASAALGFDFARAVVARDIAASDRLRTEIESRWGRRAVVSLAFSIAGGQFFPNVKYALGFGHACTRVAVAGADAPLASRELHV
ncbi:MAG: hypothetical protein WAJ92_06690 [Candidatus Acidiferrales bacterium]